MERVPNVRTLTPVWTITVHNKALDESMERADYMRIRKPIYAEVKQALRDCWRYPTQKQAKLAAKKIPKHLHEWIEIQEVIPVSLGLGWC